MKEVVDKVNKSLSSIEQIRKFILIDHEFTIENNMMTPSMKVRRFKVKEMYGENLENYIKFLFIKFSFCSEYFFLKFCFPL